MASELSVLDRLIGWASPRMGLQRAQARVAMSALSSVGSKLHYEGAARSRRTSGWWAPAGDASAAQRGALHRLRDVARDMVRNDPWAARGVNVLTQNVVGAGIVPSFVGGAAAARKRLNKTVKAYLDTKAIDADGRHDLYGLQRLIFRALVQDGEVLVRRIPRPSSAGLALPLQIRVLEVDHLDTMVDGPLAGGNFAVQGVEFSSTGKRVAYHLFDNHPGSIRMGRSLRSVRVDADMVAHVARADRPGMVRGVTWLAPVIVRLQDLHDFEDADLLRQKIAACFAAFTVDAENNRPPLALGAIDSGQDQEPLIESFEPGMIVNLPGGRDIRFAMPPTSNSPSYVSESLRAVAAALGITFESLTGNLSGVNFSSGRMGWIEMARAIDEARWSTLIPQGLEEIGRWVLDAATLVGLPTAGIRIGWTPPRREMIDPSKETASDRDAIRAGLQSWSETVRSRGGDPEELLAELVSDKKLFDDNGLVLDVDASRITRSGSTQTTTNPPAPGTPDGEATDD